MLMYLGSKLRNINLNTLFQSRILTISLPKHNLKHAIILLIVDINLGVQICKKKNLLFLKWLTKFEQVQWIVVIL